MNRRLLSLTASAIAAVSAWGAPALAAETADLILDNAAVYTVDASKPWAQTVAISRGKIVYVGDRAGSAKFKGEKTRSVDLAGKMVLPGFIDGHNHAYLMAESMFWLSLNPYKTVEERQQAIRDYVKAHPGIKQLRGVGWDKIEEDAKARNTTPKALIDAAAADIPVVVIDNSHHNFRVNSKALEIAGIGPDTANPPGGTIERDAASKEPNGILREFAAQNLVINALPQPDFTVDEYKETIRAWQKVASSYGITATFVPVHYPTEALLKAFEAMDNDNELTQRFDLALWVDENRGTDQIAYLKKMRDTYQGRAYRVDSVKIFSDGIGEKKLVWDQAVLEKTVAALDKEGFRIYVHAIGNPEFYPSHNVLNAFEKAAKENGLRGARHALTHLDWVQEADVGRFRTLGVVAVPQAAWFGKPWYDDVTGDIKKNQQRLESFIRAGVPVVSSSDFPSTDTFKRDMYPLTGIEVGMTRLDPDATTEADLGKTKTPQEKATLEQMIASYTASGAYLIFDEDNRGTIEVGKSADLVVLDKNLFEIPVSTIGEAKIVSTYFEGKQTYHDPAF